jgi:hypothetical protein
MILGDNCHPEKAVFEAERLIWEAVPNKLIGW